MIERIDYGSCYTLRLVECPVCEESLDPHVGRSVVQDHIAEHDPEDFGLSPLRERETAGPRPSRPREGSA